MKDIFKSLLSPQQPMPDLAEHDAYRRVYLDALTLTGREMYDFLTGRYSFSDVFERALDNIAALNLLDEGMSEDQWERLEDIWEARLEETRSFYRVVNRRTFEKELLEEHFDSHWNKQADHLIHSYAPSLADFMAHVTMAIKTPAISRFELKKTLD